MTASAEPPATDYPHPTSPAVSRRMRRNPRRDTRPERRLRSALHSRGLRFRVDHAIEAGTVRVRPDVVFTRLRVAVFVDGCFWHSCPLHGTRPAANRAYWEPKLLRNRVRDQQVTEALQGAGWLVVRVWEHEDPAEVADGLVRALGGRRPPSSVLERRGARAAAPAPRRTPGR